MPTNTRRLRPEELATDEDVIMAIKTMEGYAPVAGMPTIEELIMMSAKVQQCDEDNLNAQNVAMETREALVKAQWERHEAVMRVKAQVIAQYGRDSTEVRKIGLKRMIDRKRGSRRNGSNDNGS